jgi:hypothetical protein
LTRLLFVCLSETQAKKVMAELATGDNPVLVCKQFGKVDIYFTNQTSVSRRTWKSGSCCQLVARSPCSLPRQHVSGRRCRECEACG